MTKLFGRKCKLTITDENESFIYNEDFKIEFKITRNTDIKQPDTATIKLYNPFDTNFLADIEKGYVILEGGYDELTGVIFKGDIHSTSFGRVENNIIYSIVCGDGKKENEEVSFKSYAPKMKINDITKDIITEFKNIGTELASSIFNDISNLFGNDKTQQKTFLKGNKLTNLNNLLDVKDYEAVLINNTLHIKEKFKSFSTSSIILSPTSGLIGTPQKKEVTKKKNKAKIKLNVVSFQALLIPNLTPGQEIQIDSEFISGNYVIDKINITGNTYDGEWIVKGEAIEL